MIHPTYIISYYLRAKLVSSRKSQARVLTASTNRITSYQSPITLSDASVYILRLCILNEVVNHLKSPLDEYLFYLLAYKRRKWSSILMQNCPLSWKSNPLGMEYDCELHSDLEVSITI